MARVEAALKPGADKYIFDFAGRPRGYAEIAAADLRELVAVAKERDELKSQLAEHVRHHTERHGDDGCDD